MQNVDWKALFEAITAFLVAVTVLISYWNSQHIKAVRDEQKVVAAKLAEVQADGKELRLFLDSQNKAQVVQVIKPR